MEGARTGLDWTGLDWTGLDWTGLDWTDLAEDWEGQAAGFCECDDEPSGSIK